MKKRTMKWAIIGILLLLSLQRLAAQANLGLALDARGSDSIIAQVMTRHYAPAWQLATDSVKPAFSMVGIHRRPAPIDPRVIPNYKFWVPPPPSLFEAEKEREWEMQPHTFGEYFVNGVLNMLLIFIE